MKIIAFLFIIFSLGSTLFAQRKDIVVVVDAGHGGNDPGHLSGNVKSLPEKDLNLKISNLVGGYIEQYLQHVRVIYTRNDDRYVSLNDRVEKANNAGADYFISIHCNGNERTSVHGTESHVHSMSLKNSVSLARSMEHQFSARAGRKSRGVKEESYLQHSLQVLKFTQMTSVLIECGFITNPNEARYLNSTYGQEIIASAIFRGFRTELEKTYPQTAFRKSSTTVSNNSKSNYTIQIASSINEINTSDYQFRKLNEDVKRVKLNTTNAYKYIYVVGEFENISEAKIKLEQVKNKGFKDAIIIKQTN